MDIIYENNKLHIHTAKQIINENTYIYKPEILSDLYINDIIRISYITYYNNLTSWNHDAPFLKIIAVEGDNFLGEIMDINRIKNTNKYILNIGEKIWFHKSNVIEVQTTEKNKCYLTNEKVLCTGPLLTIEEEESSSDSDYTSDLSSISDSD